LHGLLRRLSGIDAEAEAAVRVIAAFDQLVAHRADIGALARAAAGLAECTAGVHDPLRSVFISVSSDGKSVPARAIPPASTVVNVDDGSGAQVWLQRAGGAGPLDAIVAERMAAAAAIILDRMYGSSSYATDLGAVELLLSEQASDVERARCARLLGLADARFIRAIALVCDRPETDVVGQALGAYTSAIRAAGDAVQLAKVGDVFAAITTGEEPPKEVPPSLRAGVGPKVDPLGAPVSWAAARSALRFTLCLPGLKRAPTASVEDLGPLMTLASFPCSALGELGDVEAIARVAASDPSGELVHTLDVFCRAGSLRRTAAELYLHHTSVAARVAHIGAILGYPVDSPDGAFRARMALALWQLSQAPDGDRQLAGKPGQTVDTRRLKASEG
jgi:PucR C-terminal helix-turn-helix domain